MNAQLQNLRALLDVGERIVASKRPFAFGAYDCGTYACFFGWYRREYPSANVSTNHSTEEALSHFGLTEKEANTLFEEVWSLTGINYKDSPADFIPSSKEAYAELTKRLDYLRELISSRTPTHGIPSSVLAIFETKQTEAAIQSVG
jgi:hypothetical protein